MGNSDNVGHNDLIFELEGLVPRSIFDTYWLMLGELEWTIDARRNAIIKLMDSWLTSLKSFDSQKESAYLVVDISDQYIGCVKVTKASQFFVLEYGFSEQGRNGDDITEFTVTSDSKAVKHEDFVSSINKQISKLRCTG